MRDFISWLNAQEPGTQGLVLVAIAAALPVAGWVVVVALPWAGALWDPTNLRKVTATSYAGKVTFRDGVQSHYAAETQGLPGQAS